MRTLTTFLLCVFGLGLSLSAQDAFEPNDNVNDAAVISCNDGVFPTFDTDDDVDWFVVTKDSPGELTVNVLQLPANINVNVEVYRFGANNQLQLITEDFDNSPGNQEDMSAQAYVEAGTYYIYVEEAGNNNSSSESYFLQVLCNDNPNEINQTLNQAVLISENTFLQDRIYGVNLLEGNSTVSQSDNDWFKVYAPAGGVLSVAVENVPQSIQPNIELYQRVAGLPTIIADDGDNSPGGGEAMYSYAYVEPDTVYIRVHDTNNNNTSFETYDLTVTFEESPYEVNQTIDLAAPIPLDDCLQERILGENSTFNVTGTGDLDRDWYEVNLPQSGYLSTRVVNVTQAIQLNLRIYRKENNQPVLLADDNDNSPGSGESMFTGAYLTAGTYYILVSESNDNQFSTETYDLCVDFFPEAKEINQTTDLATPIVPGANFTERLYGYNDDYFVTGIGSLDRDWYTYTNTNNCPLQVDVTNVPGNIQVNIELYRFNGPELVFVADDGDNSPGSGESMSLSSDISPDTYYILVHESNDNNFSTDPYTFQMTCPGGGNGGTGGGTVNLTANVVSCTVDYTNGTLTWDVSGTNTGTSAATNVPVTLFLSDVANESDLSYGNVTDLFSHTETVSNIAAGADFSVTFSVHLCDDFDGDFSNGTYSVGMVIDPFDSIDETDDSFTDNSHYCPAAITINPTTDCATGNATFNLRTDVEICTQTATDTTVSLVVFVTNDGPDPSSPTTGSMFATTETIVFSLDYADVQFLNTTALAALDVGETATIQTTVDLCDVNLAVGTYSFGFTADPQQNTPETDETFVDNSVLCFETVTFDPANCSDDGGGFDVCEIINLTETCEQFNSDNGECEGPKQTLPLGDTITVFAQTVPLPEMISTQYRWLRPDGTLFNVSTTDLTGETGSVWNFFQRLVPDQIGLWSVEILVAGDPAGTFCLNTVVDFYVGPDSANCPPDPDDPYCSPLVQTNLDEILMNGIFDGDCGLGLYSVQTATLVGSTVYVFTESCTPPGGGIVCQRIVDCQGTLISEECEPFSTAHELVVNNLTDLTSIYDSGLPPPPCTGPLTFIANYAEGASGTTIQVPITIENYNQVAGFSYTLSLADPSVGTLLGATNGALFNVATFQYPNGDLSIVYSAPGGASTPQTFPDGTEVFYVEVALNNTSDICTDLIFLNAPTPLDAYVSPDGTTLQQVPVETVSAPVCVLPEVVKSGRVFRPVAGQPPVTGVSLTCNDLLSITNDANGEYTFPGAPVGGSYSVVPSKNINHLNGITLGDIIEIRDHYLGNNQFSNPYAQIAADVTDDCFINAADETAVRRIYIMQDMAFGLVESWNFVPADYDNFDLPNGCSSPDHPEEITLSNLQNDVSDLDFIGVKMGDVDLSADGTQLHAPEDPEDRTTQLIEFQYQPLEVSAGSTAWIPVYATATDYELRGFTLEIAYPHADLRILGTEPGLLPNDFMNNAEPPVAGRFLTTWLAPGSTSFALSHVPADEPLFYLVVEQLHGNFTESEPLAIGLELRPSGAYDPQHTYRSIDLLPRQLTSTDEPNGLPGAVLHQNTPNPFGRTTTIAFTLTEADNYILTVHDLTGRTLIRHEQNYQPGRHTIQLDDTEFPSSGLFFYRLTSTRGTTGRTMVHQATR